VKSREDTRARPWLRGAILAALLLTGGTALIVWREPLWALFGDQARVQAWIASFGPFGPLISASLNAAQVLLAPIPGQIVGLANGYLYGTGLGTLYSMLGLLAGTWLAMALARVFGRPLVLRVVNAVQLERWDRIAARQGPWFFFLFFLIPGLPDDMLCFVIGLSPLPLGRMLVLALLGRVPGVWVSCWVGAHATTLPWWVWVPLGAGSAVLAWAFWRHRNRIETALVGFIARFADRAGRPRRSGSSAGSTPAPEQEEH